MIRSLYTAATGMQAQQLFVDNIANNLANINTTAFKKQKLEFADLMYQNLVEPGSASTLETTMPTGLQVGLGVKSIANQRIFSQGSLTQTENPFDMAIQGEGFLRVLMPDGREMYTRDGALKKSEDGTLVTSLGFGIEPEIVIPENSEQFNVDRFGRITVVLEGDTLSTEIGQLELAKFINPAGLKGIGNNLFQSTRASGEPVIEIPGEKFTGTLHQGWLEQSNVAMVEEMVNMITAQRAYEISSKAVQVSEEMLQIANQIKR